ncbi:MAG: thioesterase [Chloroflexi bacterium]|nr:thioesterase [Chloroflexota bacterium]
MTNKQHHFTVHIYYEDTDFSGLVYHANYLKYFERAREHALDQARLVRLVKEERLGFVVYKLDMQFAEGAEFGDALDIRSTWELEGVYRMNWRQEVWRPGGKKAAVVANIQLVCIDHDRQLKPIPTIMLD